MKSILKNNRYHTPKHTCIVDEHHQLVELARAILIIN
jgi:hypothetical protein